MVNAHDIRFTSLGVTEDWSTQVHNMRTGKDVYVIDTGGRYELCRDLDAYSADREQPFASFEIYRDATERAIEETR